MSVFSEALEFSVGLDLSGFKKGLKAVEQSAKKSGSVVGGAFSLASKGIVAAGTAVTLLGGLAVATGAKFETLETRLSTLLGSAEAGSARLNQIFDFASSTPFELDELVEAEVNLRALGTQAEVMLPLVMDFAGAMNTDLAGAAVEVGRAMQFGAGAVESMAGRALRAQVELRTGQDALKMGIIEWREALVETLTATDGIFAGGTAKLAQTFGGMISNLQDQWTGFRKQVADAGLFAGVKASLGITLDLLNENKRVVGEIATGIADGLVWGLKAAIYSGGFVLRSFYAIEFTLNEIGRIWAKTLSLTDDLALASIGWVHVLERVPMIGDAIGEGLEVVEEMILADQRAAEGMAAAFTIAGDIAASKMEGVTEATGQMIGEIELAVQAAKNLGKANGEIGGRAPGAGPVGTGAASGMPLPEFGQVDWDAVKAELFEAQSQMREAEIEAQRVAQGIRSAFVDAFTDITNSASSVFAELVSRRVDEFSAARSDLMALDETATTAERNAAEERTRTARREAERAFKIQQGLDIASATMAGAVAFVKALTLGPIAGPIAAASISATTGAQIGLIASQQPTFDIGGIVGAALDQQASAGLQVGQRQVVARDGEAYLTAQQRQNLGLNSNADVRAAGRGDGRRAQMFEFQVGPYTTERQYFQAIGASGQMRRATAALRSNGFTNFYAAA